MATPRYPRTAADELADARTARTAAQTAGQSRAPFAQASKGLVLPNLGADPAPPPSGVILYAKAGHLYCREADGSVHQLTS
ncbi:hypothetical protein ABT340_35770 [Streptosporangium sp. NPDC000239]|uniref:hypothetical protein n=1 Tax=Streptosporangium sp. NPDC000239 TaxID=3154248 RepID=UPI00331B9A0C